MLVLYFTLLVDFGNGRSFIQMSSWLRKKKKKMACENCWVWYYSRWYCANCKNIMFLSQEKELQIFDRVVTWSQLVSCTVRDQKSTPRHQRSWPLRPRPKTGTGSCWNKLKIIRQAKAHRSTRIRADWSGSPLFLRLILKSEMYAGKW